MWIAGDINGHVGDDSQSNEVTGKYGLMFRNEGRERIADFAISNDKAVVNTYFQKRQSRLTTYCIGRLNT